jgi:hypothetical protein
MAHIFTHQSTIPSVQYFCNRLPCLDHDILIEGEASQIIRPTSIEINWNHMNMSRRHFQLFAQYCRSDDWLEVLDSDIDDSIAAIDM